MSDAPGLTELHVLKDEAWREAEQAWEDRDKYQSLYDQDHRELARVKALLAEVKGLKGVAFRTEDNVAVPSGVDGTLDLPVWRFHGRDWVEGAAVKSAYGLCQACPLRKKLEEVDHVREV